MIRLNDYGKTVVDENLIICYSKNDESTGINLVLSSRAVFVEYTSYKTRDKDIKLLDKIFDVKSIKNKVEERVEESKPNYDFGKPQAIETEKYITWRDVKQYATPIKAKFPNGDIRPIYYNETNHSINVVNTYGFSKDAAIYDENLFNALMLKEE